MPIRDIDTRIGYKPIEVSTPGNSTVVVVDHPTGGGGSRYARRPLLGGISSATIFGALLILTPLVLLFYYFPGDRGKLKQLQGVVAAKDAAIAQQQTQLQTLNTQVVKLQSEIAAGQAQQQKMAADIRGAIACIQPLNAAYPAPAPSPTTGGQQ